LWGVVWPSPGKAQLEGGGHRLPLGVVPLPLLLGVWNDPWGTFDAVEFPRPHPAIAGALQELGQPTPEPYQPAKWAATVPRKINLG
jgi:hypothetical protein